MGPDLELKGRSEIIMDVSASKENGCVMQETEDKHMNCVSNYEDHTFGMEDFLVEQGAHRSEVEEVNIMECTNSGYNGLLEAECQDTSETSSSFGDTSSGIENGAILGDDDVQSDLRGDTASVLPFDELGNMFPMRKKKLTSHWRTFIRPLAWRCKWVELQLKKLQTQAIKYDRELAEINQRKQFKPENFTLEGFGSKSLPFPSQSRRGKVMKRMKRKRVEDTMDMTTYMSNHNLFSYYENRKSTADGATVDDCWGNLAISTDKKIIGNNEFGVKDELFSLEFRDGDNSLEQMLWKIEVVQSQVFKLKTRLNKVTSENAGRFSSADELSLLVPCNALTSYAPSPAAPAINVEKMPGGSSYIASQVISEHTVGEVVMLGSAVSNHGELTHLPDVIESSDQLLSCKSASAGDGILVYNRRAKEKKNDFEEVMVLEKLQVPKEEQGSTIPPVLDLEDQLADDDQPTPKIRYISKLTAPNNKRKRGRRKAASSKWSRRSSA